MRKILILPFGIFFLLLVTGGYASTFNVTQCAVLSENNTDYVLNTSFTNTTANACLNITGFNDTLDCQGYNINGASSSYGIYVSWASIQNTNVTIKNCNITNWLYGIHLTSAGNNTIVNNTLSGSDTSNIYFSSSNNNNITNNTLSSGTFGIYLDYNSYDNILTNNTITRTSNQQGLFVYGGSSISSIRNNIDETNTINGKPIYYIDGVSRTCVNNTVYTNGSSYGYMAFVGCNNITIQSSSPSDGVMLAGTTGSTINGLSVSNTQYPLYMPVGASNNAIINNIFNSNSYAIRLLTNSNNNNIINNTANSNTMYGIFISSSNNNTIVNNTANGNNIGFYIYSSSNNIIANSSIASSASYDYYVHTVDSTNNFTNTNFTGTRYINFQLATDWFNYANDTTSLQLRTNGIAGNYISRTLNSWNILNISWNDLDSSTDAANYTIYGLLTNNNYTVYNNSVLRHTLNASSCGCLNFTIGLTTSSQTIQVSTDTTPPTWSANNSSTPTNYSSTPSQFNISWSDNVNISNVLITIRNPTGVLINNASMSNTYGGNIYNYSVILPAGTFNWTSYANDTSGNWNLTNTWVFTISNASNPINIYLNDTLNSNRTYTYPQAINATATSAEGTVYIYRNEIHVVNGTSPRSELILLGYGVYVYKVNATGNANYSDNTTAILYNASVSKGTPTGSISGSNVTLPSTTSITPSESNAGDADVNYSFWRDTSLVSLANGTTSISGETQSTAGTYTYKLSSTAGDNWTANSSISTLVITVAAAPSTTTTSGSSIGGITSTGMITYINLAVGKANITANYLTTGGKLIANIARYQDVAIRGLNVTVVNNVANIKIMISKLPSLPSNVPYDINGRVYHYISTSEQNFTDADIKSVNISFAVNKTWLTNNNIDASNITMYRWANNKWNDLNAVKVSDNGNEVFFTVSSPGLSVFIIGTKGGAPAVTETPATCTESWACTDWSTCANNQQTKTCTDSNNCGTTTSKPSESQSCTVSKAETTVPSPVPTSILTTIIVVVIALIACVFIFLQRAKISSYLVTVTKKSGNHKKTSYLESLARKVNKVEEEEEEKLNVRTD